MPLTLSWEQIALRLALAAIASFCIGFNRDERGHPAGIRTTMLVCLVATLAMLQVNILLPMSGKTPSSFAVMDLMRLPLGILSGIGFIGAGVIMKRDHELITGVTTAATMWYVTMLGLLFGGGQLSLGVAAFILAMLILWLLKYVESRIPRKHNATLRLTLALEAPAESDLRTLLESHGEITRWQVLYDPPDTLTSLECELRWQVVERSAPHTPEVAHHLRRLAGVRSITWDE
jgi:putative Mg2+ transporter-C (MgtC) family protein